MGRADGDPPRVVVRAHAKINLALHVEGVRPDGYHGLRTVFQSLALHDVLTIEAAGGPLSLSCSAAGVPNDERNLVWRAATRLWACAGREGQPHGVRMRLAKRIPAQGGLGGGSADAAAALVGLDAVWRTNMGAARLAAVARDIGADVPFFLCGGTALGLGRGDEIYPLEDLLPRAVVLVFPPFGVSTPDAFRWFDEDAMNEREPAVAGPRADGGHVLLGGTVALPVVNDLQGPVGRRHPELVELCHRLRAAGAEGAAMTGSGSTVFGLFAVDAVAEAAAGQLRSSGWHTLVTRCVSRRVARPGARLVWTRSSRIH